MHIHIKKRLFFFQDYKVKCAIGKRGIKKKRREGDLITPKGTFKIKKIFYRPDRVKNLKSKIRKEAINRKMGWCDDPKSKKYNMLIRYPFNYNSEKFYRSDNIYDIVLVLNFNMNPIKKNFGSAIFIHVAKKKYSPTRGCIAIKKVHLKKIIKKLTNSSKVIIH